MDLGLVTFSTDYSMPVAELAVAAEERGFESLFLTEHTHIPASRHTPYPRGGELPREYLHTLDPFVALRSRPESPRPRRGVRRWLAARLRGDPPERHRTDRRAAGPGGRRRPGRLPVTVFGVAPQPDRIAELAAAGVTRALLLVPSAGTQETLVLLDQLAELLPEAGTTAPTLASPGRTRGPGPSAGPR